jgi:hypothetical protein
MPRRPSASNSRYFTTTDLIETLYRGPADNTVSKIVDTSRA